MKELFTKSFWLGVEKTFQEALEDPPPAEPPVLIPADGESGASSTSKTQSSPSAPAEQS